MTPLVRAFSIASALSTALAIHTVVPSAQTPGAGLPCVPLLTNDELAKAVAPGFQYLGAEERNPGESSCEFLMRSGPGGPKSVSVQFYTMAIIRQSPTTPTPETYFEDLVKPIETVSKTKREVLPGIGQRAAFVAADPQVLAVVQLANGIARIVGNNLTKAQITAVARAVATP